MTDELDVATPNCPDCLHPLSVKGDFDSVHWHCNHCGYDAIAR